jgi:hypothetical protein
LTNPNNINYVHFTKYANSFILHLIRVSQMQMPSLVYLTISVC